MTPAELNAIFRAYLLKFTRFSDDLVFLGNQNRVGLPNVKDFMVFTELMAVPVSFGTEGFDVALGETPEQDVGTWTVSQLHKVTYQVDAWGQIGIEKLNRVKVAFGSGMGAEFFKQYADRFGGVGIVGARTYNATTDTDGTPEYAPRRKCDFIVTVRLNTEIQWDWAEELKIDLNGGFNYAH